MAGQGKKTFSDGEVLSAADVNGYLMDQSVMRFADSAARTAAIGTPTEGMVTYLDDVNQIEVYDGTAWVDQQAPILSEGTAGQYLQSNGTAGSQWVTLEIAENIITAQGDLIVGASDNTPERLGIGAADTVLTSNGTAVTWSPAGGGDGSFNYSASGGASTTETFGTGLFQIQYDGSGELTFGGRTYSNGIHLDKFDTDPASLSFAAFNYEPASWEITENNGFVADGSIINDGTNWVACRSFGSSYAVSTDRFETITVRSFPENKRYIEHHNGLYVATGNQIHTSTDLINWTLRLDVGAAMSSVRFLGDRWVTQTTTNIYWSFDGITWNTVSAPWNGSVVYKVNYVTVGGTGRWVWGLGQGFLAETPDNSNRFTFFNYGQYAGSSDTYEVLGLQNHFVSIQANGSMFYSNSSLASFTAFASGQNWKGCWDHVKPAGDDYVIFTDNGARIYRLDNPTQLPVELVNSNLIFQTRSIGTDNQTVISGNTDPDASLATSFATTAYASITPKEPLTEL